MRVNLNDGWEVLHKPLAWGVEKAERVLEESAGWLKADLPCDIHMPLIEQGIIRDPVDALYSFDCEWTEAESWWFRKTFAVDEALLEQEIVELTMNCLDAAADVFLNGQLVGHHRSVHYPFTAEIKNKLKRSGNCLLVRITSGAEEYSQAQISPFAASVSTTPRRGDARRVFLRKPQYVFGWDWGPRVVTCGLAGDVELRAYSGMAVRGCHAYTASIRDGNATLRLRLEVQNLHTYRTMEAVAEVRLLFRGRQVAALRREALLRSGLNYLDFELQLENAWLWWPNGLGEQNLYEARVALSGERGQDALEPFCIAIRTLGLNLDKINSSERLFALEINGRKVFCKGANWIPADSIYARVTEEKYDTLLRQAREANFNMLRVWGGGIYEPEVFYKKCDEYGILIWQDFMFACAVYPDNAAWFRQEVEREIDYQTRRLRNHPCLAVWSGNNENQWGFHSWWTKTMEFPGGAHIYNQLAPALVQKNCPNIPYWNGSPYGGADPNGNEVGDRHHWLDCTMNPEMEKRITPEEYDKVGAKFVSEYGYIGPCVKSSILKYHDGAPVDRASELWNWHNNTFEKETVLAGIAKHYRESKALSLDDYLLYAGLCQGLMYGYSLESIRSKEDCWGALFWMYSDCWGEVGWTIIDYYGKRKPSFYYVKRAFSPVRLIMRAAGERLRVVGINDTDGDRELRLEYRYTGFDGKNRKANETVLTLKGASRAIILEWEKTGEDERRGLYYVRPMNPSPEVLPAQFRSGPFRSLQLPAARLALSEFRLENGRVSFTVSSAAYAHAVHFEGSDDLCFSDNYFDLLPGESRTIQLEDPPRSFCPKDLRLRSIID
jgi:beta-mannosidase